MDINKVKGHAAGFSAGVMWGLMAPVAKLVLAAGIVSPLMMTGFRMAGAAVLFWAASLFVPHERVPRADLLRLAAAAMLGIVLNQGSYILCLISGLELLADLDLWLGCQCLVVAQFVGLRGECLGLHQNSLTRCKRKC